MKPEEKFHIPSPSKERLEAIGVLVDEVENMSHQGKDYQGKLDQLNSIFTVPVDIDYVCSYYGSCSREEFIADHLIPDPYQHKNLTDDELVWLIRQIKENFCDSALYNYYSTIIQTNTMADLNSDEIFESTPEKVLDGLKKNKRRVFNL